MSTLEKTISLLSELPESQVEVVYSYVQFLTAEQNKIFKVSKGESKEDALTELIGCISDTGKSLSDYRDERMQERYGIH